MDDLWNIKYDLVLNETIKFKKSKIDSVDWQAKYIHGPLDLCISVELFHYQPWESCITLTLCAINMTYSITRKVTQQLRKGFCCPSAQSHRQTSSPRKLPGSSRKFEVLRLPVDPCVRRALPPAKLLRLLTFPVSESWMVSCESLRVSCENVRQGAVLLEIFPTKILLPLATYV